ncbi:MAG: hypothetical protein N2C12_03400, partial [Planctomycetales bacterium]
MDHRQSDRSIDYKVSLRTICVFAVIAVTGCSQNPNFPNLYGGPGGPNGGMTRTPTGSPAEQVAQIEQWRQEAVNEASGLRNQVAQLTQQNSTLQTQISNVQQHATLQDEHLASVNERLKNTTSELANIRNVGQDASQNAASMDRLNEEKERQLASSRQSVQRLEAELQKSQSELQTANTQLAQSETDAAESQRTIETLVASNRQRGGASIAANSNLAMPNINAEGVTVQRDGQVIRVRFSAARLFDPDTVRRKSDATGLVRNVASQLAQTYPAQRIGVEGHADGGSRLGGPWRNEHHLSSAQAMAVYEFLTTQSLF